MILDIGTEAQGSMSASFGSSSKWIVKREGEYKVSLEIIVQSEYKGSWFKGSTATR